MVKTKRKLERCKIPGCEVGEVGHYIHYVRSQVHPITQAPHETFSSRLERFEQTIHNLRVDVDALKATLEKEDWI